MRKVTRAKPTRSVGVSLEAKNPRQKKVGKAKKVVKKLVVADKSKEARSSIPNTWKAP